MAKRNNNANTNEGTTKMKLYAWDLNYAREFARGCWLENWSREKVAGWMRKNGRGGYSLRRVLRAFDDFQKIEA